MQQQPFRRSPYQGLTPYTEMDAQFFFGREKEIRLIIANLFASPLTLLYGPSGVGKSSVLRAGISYRLNQRPNAKVLIHYDWKDNPLSRLKTQVGTLAGLTESLAFDHSLMEVLRESTRVLNSRLMIVLDQFEEYFLYHPLEDEFTTQFSKAVLQEDSPVSFLISIREDALAKLDRFEGRIPFLFDNYLRLEHLDDQSARLAIENPIEKYNELYVPESPVELESSLIEEVLAELKSEQVSLTRSGYGVIESSGARSIETPYLQLVMMRLWAQEMSRNSRMLRLETLRLLGGAETIVKSHLDLIMKRLSSDHQLLASKVFQYLVTPSGTKIALSAADLSSFVDIPIPAVKSLLQRLSEQDVRLLRAIELIEKNDVVYEIFHDVLAAPILDWRERWQYRYKLRSRSSLIALAILMTIVYIGIAFAFMQSSIFEGINKLEENLACILPLVCLSAILGLIGFVTGVNWTQTR